MLLTLLGGRIFSKLVSYMTEGVDVTNSAWDPFFYKLVPYMTDGVDVTNSAWGPTFFTKLVKKGSMLLTLLGVDFFSKLVPYTTEGVDVTNSAWGPFFPSWSPT
jgi:hypothetical protein